MTADAFQPPLWKRSGGFASCPAKPRAKQGGLLRLYVTTWLFPGDLRTLRGNERIPLPVPERKLRIKLKSKAWNAGNAEKRRISSRNSKRTLRALHDRKREVPQTYEALAAKRRRDREYSRRRYLLGLRKPAPAKFFSLDAVDTPTLEGLIGYSELSPLEMLILKEEAMRPTKLDASR